MEIPEVGEESSKEWFKLIYVLKFEVGENILCTNWRHTLRKTKTKGLSVLIYAVDRTFLVHFHS
jgi:hypothetical protein